MAPHLEGFPIVITVPVAWGEMDAFGHVNNIVFFRYFESARIAYLDAIGFRGDAPGSIGPILASTHCRFRRPLAYPDTVRIGARATELTADRFTMEYRVVSEALGETAAAGGGVIVAYDYAAGRKALLPETVRARIRDLEATSPAGR
ncbi:MAG TPA: thioesterase family protein [Longimicrobiales bacterium]